MLQPTRPPPPAPRQPRVRPRLPSPRAARPSLPPPLRLGLPPGSAHPRLLGADGSPVSLEGAGGGCLGPPQARVAATRGSESPGTARRGPGSLWCAAVGPALASGAGHLPPLRTGTAEGSPSWGPGPPGTGFGNAAPEAAACQAPHPGDSAGWTLGRPHSRRWGDRPTPTTSCCATRRSGVTRPGLRAASRAPLSVQRPMGSGWAQGGGHSGQRPAQPAQPLPCADRRPLRGQTLGKGLVRPGGQSGASRAPSSHLSLPPSGP